ncbi:MFS general substrate transporter [Mycena indigotica]|uniref:MFS general substrate transporter n=1 Tax=Mycena indigotica TaxID=2126181 RepID=A0A8H6SAV9_9AGAR|nr:MFS general substrate transporter [Mycena indigotica]KAF7295582.1 MFS general substrate transporter [Mycena indigotica]
MADQILELRNDGLGPSERRKVHWFRGTVFQIFVIGGVFFCAPGMYNALTSLGAGGLATPWYANATAAAGYAFMAVLCVTGGIIVSKIGVKPSLLISSTGDIIYAGSLYLNSKNGTQWFLMFGAGPRFPSILVELTLTGSIYSGCTDGLMYTVEGPIITSYPEPDRRGRMLALWVSLRNAAPVIGGAIIFGLNNKIDSSGGVSLQTYLVIIGIMCAGPFIALLLSHPEKVQRKDGVKIVLRKMDWTKTMSEWWNVVCSRDVDPPALPTVLYLMVLWLVYRNVGNSIYERPYSSAVCLHHSLWRHCWWACNWVFPRHEVFLRQTTRTDKLYQLDGTQSGTMGSILSLKSVCLLSYRVWAAIITKRLEVEKPIIDWTSGSIFGSTFILFVLFDFATMATQTCLFWIISHMSDDFIALSYMTGTLRGVECAGQAVAYGIKSSNTTDWLSIGLNVGLIVFSLPFAWAVVRKIGVVEFDKISFAIGDGSSEKSVDVESEKEKA